jgi:signal transduction histidine kinase
MGPHASTSFLFGGIALLVVRHASDRCIRFGQTLSFVGAAFATVTVTGYGYGAEELYGIAPYTGIALHTAITFVLLHLGILAASAHGGVVARFVDDGFAGTVLRRLTVPVVVLPPLLGYLYLFGREGQVVDRGLGMALYVVATIVMLFAVLWRTAGVIDAADRERRRAAEVAARASRLKDQFIAVLSHELRTPLNVMLGRLRLLQRETDPETRVRAATVITRNGKLLARLVEDLLDLSRATAGSSRYPGGPPT